MKRPMDLRLPATTILPAYARERVLGGFALGRRAMTATSLQPLEPPLGHRQVGEQEFQIDPLQVASRVDAALRVDPVRARPETASRSSGAGGGR